LLLRNLFSPLNAPDAMQFQFDYRRSAAFHFDALADTA